MTARHLSDEELRILAAADDGRLFVNAAGRYEIEDEIPPDAATRKALEARGLMLLRSELTKKGSAVISRELKRRSSA